VEEKSSLARDTRTRGQHSGEFPETSFCLINLRLRAKAAGNLKMQTDTFKKIPAFSSQWNKKGPASKTEKLYTSALLQTGITYTNKD
jgi:hypothetical protein